MLLLRQSHRRGLTFPGGGLRRGEDPAAAARGELQEEVELAVPATALRHVRSVTAPFGSCRDHVAVFELTLDAAPSLRPDNQEIVWAGFLDPGEALADAKSPPHIRLYLERHRGVSVPS